MTGQPRFRPCEPIATHVPAHYRYLMQRLAEARRYRGRGGTELVTIVMHASRADELYAALSDDLEAQTDQPAP